MSRKIAMVFNQNDLKTSNQALEDLDYWMNKSPVERLSAVTFLVNQNLKPSERMDKSFTARKSMKQ